MVPVFVPLDASSMKMLIVKAWSSLDPRPNPRGRVWGKTLPRSVLRRWNAAISVDEGMNITSTNQCSS